MVESKRQIDSNWFYNQLERLDITLDTLGKLMEWEGGKPLSKAAVSLMLRGQRDISVHEAGRLAQIFSVSIEEISRRAGAPMPKYVQPGEVVEREARESVALAKRSVTLAQKVKNNIGPVGFKRVRRARATK